MISVYSTAKTKLSLNVHPVTTFFTELMKKIWIVSAVEMKLFWVGLCLDWIDSLPVLQFIFVMY